MPRPGDETVTFQAKPLLKPFPIEQDHEKYSSLQGITINQPVTARFLIKHGDKYTAPCYETAQGC
jgi:hypothetical protein